MTPGLIHGLGAPVIGFPVRVCHQSLHRFRGKMGFPSYVASSGLVPLGFGSFFSLTPRFSLRGSSWDLMAAAIPAPFKGLIIHPRHLGSGQAVFSLGSGVNINTFSASLEGFQVQHCSFAAPFAFFEG